MYDKVSPFLKNPHIVAGDGVCAHLAQPCFCFFTEEQLYTKVLQEINTRLRLPAYHAGGR